MPADFPTGPTTGQTYTFSGRTWRWNGTGWEQVANSLTAGFIEHSNTITASVTLSSGKNAISAGPVTINTGVTVTVPSGQYWVIV